MTKQTKAAREKNAKELESLRKWIKPGDTVYTTLDHVSSSGLSRDIRIVVPQVDDKGKVFFIHPNYAAQIVLGWPRARKGEGIRVGGCGMDMGFHLVYELSAKLYPGIDAEGKPGCKNGRGYALKQAWL